MTNYPIGAIKVLDHGFVKMVDCMGGDLSIVQAARISYGAGTKTAREDAGLINYLMRNDHTSPFEMVEFKFHIKMPIFVARQWVRHRTASINEVSARYSVLPNEFYIPNISNICAQSKTNKQGSADPLPETKALAIQELITVNSATNYSYYEELLALGLSRELARMVLPLNIYTEWYWKANLHNTLHFLKLRLDSHAQYEIRAYAIVLAGMLEQSCPVTYKAFIDHKLAGQKP